MSTHWTETVLKHTGPDYPLCRLYHGRGPRPPRNGAPADQLSNFYHTVLTFERSVYVTTTKKGRQLFWEKSEKCTATDKKILPSRWYGAPEWLIRP